MAIWPFELVFREMISMKFEIILFERRVLEVRLACCLTALLSFVQLRVILKLKPGATMGKLCTAQQVGLFHWSTLLDVPLHLRDS